MRDGRLQGIERAEDRLCALLDVVWIKLSIRLVAFVGDQHRGHRRLFERVQHDGHLFERVLVGDVVQGACGVNAGHAVVQGPADSVFLVDVDVLELQLQHTN